MRTKDMTWGDDTTETKAINEEAIPDITTLTEMLQNMEYPDYIVDVVIGEKQSRGIGRRIPGRTAIIR